MSTHRCPVVEIRKHKHPHADSLSLMAVEGYQVCLRTDDWEDGQLAVYVPSDYVVPDTPLFDWLNNGSCNNWQRIRSRRFRGLYSHGILVPAPDGLALGDNAMELLGITRYEPPIPEGAGEENDEGPQGHYPKYDVETFQAFRTVIQPGEEVVITEKMHGASSRYTFSDNVMHCGSRIFWKKENSDNLWWDALEQNPGLRHWCERNPGLVAYGEVFGMVKHYRYGAKPNQLFFAGFDILDKDRWLDYDEAREIVGDYFLWAPELYRGPFDASLAVDISMKDSSWHSANHLSEGVVIRPVRERVDPNLGRVHLKLVSPRYLEKG